MMASSNPGRDTARQEHHLVCPALGDRAGCPPSLGSRAEQPDKVAIAGDRRRGN
jgi:hypothetical protein